MGTPDQLANPGQQRHVGGGQGNGNVAPRPEMLVHDYMDAKGASNVKSGQQKPAKRSLIRRMFPNMTRSIVLRVAAVALSGLLIAGAISVLMNPVGLPSFLLAAIFLAVALGCMGATGYFTWTSYKDALAQQKQENESFTGDPDVNIQDYAHPNLPPRDQQFAQDPNDAAARMLAEEGQHYAAQTQAEPAPPFVQDAQTGSGVLGSTSNLRHPRGASGTATPNSALNLPSEGAEGFRPPSRSRSRS